MINRPLRNLNLFVLSMTSLFSINVSEAKVIGRNDCNIAGKITPIEGSNITIYNQNKALIKTTRTFDLEKGLNTIDWNDFPNAIDIHSVSLRCLQGANAVDIKEQNYQSDFLNSYTLLTHSLGQTVHIRHYLMDGKTEEQSGTLLSNDGLVKVGDRYLLNQTGQIELDALPSELVAQPTITFLLKARESGAKNLLLSYETAGINWQCDYTLTLNDNQDKLDLTSWITIDNKSGATFKQSNLKLIAGNVRNLSSMPMAMGRMFSAESASGAADASIGENSFADYHLYTVPGTVDLNSNETKRLNLIERNSIPVVKKYVFDQHFFGGVPPAQKIPVQIKLEFQNDDKYKQPFPAGQVRVYQEDADKELQLIGSDQIFHRAVGEKINITLGDAFDVMGERSHVNSELTADRRRLDTYKVTFTNRLNKDITVSDIEHAGDLAIFSSDLPFTKVNSNTYQFDVKVPASGTTEITYQIKSRK